MRASLIVLLCVYGFSTTISHGAFPVLLPDLGAAAGLADWELGVVAGAFGFARLAGDIPSGLVITNHVRRALLVAPVLQIVGVLIVGSGGPLPVLVLGRLVMGLADGLSMVSALTVILRYQAPGALAAALNAFELSAMLGVLAGTGLVGLLPAALPWNVAFLVVTGPPMLVAVVMIRVVAANLPREEAAGGRPLFARHRATPGERPALTSGVVLAFATGAVVAVAYSTLQLFAIPLRGSREFGLDRSGVAGLLMTAQVCDILVLIPAGLLSDRLGTVRVLAVLLLAHAGGAALIGFGNFALLILGCALFGVGMAGWTFPLALLRAETPAAQIGWRTALYRVGVDGGMFLGPFVSGLLATTAPGLLPGACAIALVALAVAVGRRARAVRPVASAPNAADGAAPPP